MSSFQYNQEAVKNLKIDDTSILDRLVDFESAREAHLKKEHAKVDKRMSLKEAIATFVTDGDIMTDSGFAYVRTPHQAYWEIMRQGKKNLQCIGAPNTNHSFLIFNNNSITRTTPTWVLRCGVSTGITTVCSGKAG